MRQLYLTLLLVALVASCKKHTVFVTNSADYNRFLTSEPVKTTSKFFELWNGKITPDSIQLLSFGNVAAEYDRYFKKTGDITYLKKAEQALTKAVAIAAINKGSYQRALARNYIAQHRFKEALPLAEAALELGSDLIATQGLLFDIHMELGNYTLAKNYLDSIRNMSDFGYLIRVAKWNDHQGELETTIRFMEKAAAKAESSGNTNLMEWSYTNLADYYGHAGRIEASYDYYLKALALDPQNAYAKKGIAWIVFSHEKNGKEALRILDAINWQYNAPDHYLLKAEIAAFMGRERLKVKYLEAYSKAIRDKRYGAMYTPHTITFYLEDPLRYYRAKTLAKQEVANRATPETYGLLAYTYLRMGEHEKALEIAEQHIAGKTYEPETLYRLAEIYKVNKKMEAVAPLKKELAGAVYEMGPGAKDKIERL